MKLYKIKWHVRQNDNSIRHYTGLYYGESRPASYDDVFDDCGNNENGWKLVEVQEIKEKKLFILDMVGANYF